MALLKKRALAEYTQVIQEENVPEPRKKLRLVHKPKSLEPPLSFHGISTPDETLHTLLRFERNLPIEAEQLDHCMRLLLEQYYGCKDSALRAKIASLCGLLSKTPNIDVSRTVNDILNFLKTEGSNTVISQLLEALLTCGQIVPYNKKLHNQLVVLSLQHLNNSCHLVKSKSLNIVGSLGSPDQALNTSAGSDRNVDRKSSERKSSLQQTLGKFTHDPDSRVRMSAFEAMLSWHQRGLQLEHGIYDKACQALTDDYEGVRSVAIKLIWVLSQIYPERKVKVAGSDEENRLIDDGFAKICDMINDGTVTVRTEAASLLGSLHGVSQKFLNQTLEKMLMSGMQKRRSATDRLRDKFSGGGFSSGKKWADDAPKEGEVDDSVTMMAIGACGAFVHGLEDEFMEVRMAAIDSVCELATRSENFAMQCVDALVDMFNDEIENVQLNAINSLRKFSHVIVLREDQLEVIMGCMKAQSYEVREAFRNLLGCVKFATRLCLNSCVSGMLELLKKYPQDRQDLWKCMKNIGNRHPSFVLSLTPDLLSCHPYFEAIEPDVEDPAYVAVLLLVFNAAVQCPSIVSLFPEHADRHYIYLRDTLPNLVPPLNIRKASMPEMFHSPARCVSPNSFLHQTMDRLEDVNRLDTNGAAELIRMGIRDLERVSELEATLAPNASLMSTFLECHLCLCKVLVPSNQNVSSFIKQSPVNAGQLLEKVVSMTHKMEHEFLGLAIGDRSEIIQLRILAQSVQLLNLLRNNLTGMKQSCVQYLQILNSFERFLLSNNLTSNPITQYLLSNMNKLETCDPPVYHTVISEAVCSYKPRLLRLDNNVKKANAFIIEPSSNLEKTITFISGLSAAVDMVISLEDLENTDLIRLQIKYPDQQIHTFIPKTSDFRQLSPCRHRLITKVLLSHQQWSEACQVEVAVVLCYTKDKEFTEDRTSDKYKKTEDYIYLCKPIKLSVAPKSLKK